MNKTFLFLSVLLLIISCKPISNSAQKTVSNQPIKDSLTLELKNLNKNYFNGFAVAIVDSTGILYEEGIGSADVNSKKPYTVNTVQPIASISKTLIGVSLMIAQEKGLLNLDDPINKYLPFEVKNPDFPNDEITIRELATHTSTIVDTENYMDRTCVLENKIDSTVIKIENIPQNFNPNETKISLTEYLKNYLSKDGKWYNKNAFSKNRPGQLFEYTNVGACLAAYIIEIASKQTYADFTTKYILKPLKMNASGWNYKDVDPNNVSTLYENPRTKIPAYSLITYPDGGFLTTIHDLSKYLNELIRGYSGSGTLLSKESYIELFKPQLKEENFTKRNASNPYSDEYNMGIFMGISAMNNIGHTGGDPGVSSILFFNPKDKVGRILLINTNINNQEEVNAYFKIFNTLEDYSKKLIK